MAVERPILVGIFLALSVCHCTFLAAGQITHPREANALKAVRRSLNDPFKNLWNWKKSDPCLSNWTGVICVYDPNDGYRHIQELRLLKMNLSGTLAPELGQLPNMTILDFLWNNLSGSIPKEIGNITALQLLLLSGNQITGPLPDELGNLSSLTKFQLDLNYISGPIPKSFAKLPKVKHFHMNNNSISGQIPPELYKLPLLQHFLLDNNNLSGYLPPEFSMMPNLRIIQVDNNNFAGSEIPISYANMSNLLKLSLRNCSLQGSIPDLSGISRLLYVDLSHNQLTGSLPSNQLAANITTIDLSNNKLNGSIPSNFSNLPRLQRLSLENNLLNGSVPSAIWNNMNFSADAKLTVDLQNNSLSDITGNVNIVPPSNVTIKLQGNPVCTNSNVQNIARFCGPVNDSNVPGSLSNSTNGCGNQCPTDSNFEYVPESPVPCFCAAPFGVRLQLRSPSIADFPPYKHDFRVYLTTNLSLDLYQLDVDSIEWVPGPRLRMLLKFFPQYSNVSHKFNVTEIQRIERMFATFTIPGNDTFGPYDLFGFTLGLYANDFMELPKSGISKAVIAAIVLGATSCAIAIVFAVIFVFIKIRPRNQHEVSRDQSIPRVPIKMEGVKGFSFKEMEMATSNFSITCQVGQGGYGKVYKGTLADGTVVAIKRAQQGSLQGEKEFFTEIELLSRLHHRNLVSLLGYCDEESEQMLVYEFMANGSLHDNLFARFKESPSFGMRLQIALGAAKGILYLHSEADPPIIHRDIKANNILLDSKFNAKVSDFGISKLAPVSDAKGVEMTHVSTVVKGTPGYLDPEYFLTHQLTEKSDVYSLGIVFLELVTGMQPISHGKHIIREVNAACQSGKMFSIIDRSMGPYPSECIKRFMALALKSSHDETKLRPSMLEVVRELEDISSLLPKTDTVPLELDTSTSGIMSGSVAQSLVYSERNSYMSSDFPGSDLVSGVIPTIKPR